MGTDTWRLGHRPGLDGIRAFAVIAVMLFHSYTRGFAGGGYGVDMFFALSGFLITSILVEELADTGAIQLGRFWMRRALRLFPALVVMVCAVAAVSAQFEPETRHAIAPTLLYVSNWWRAFGHEAAALGHTWSLAIEEQFYLLWPLVLYALWRIDRSFRTALRVTCVLIVVSAAARALVIAAGASEPRWYNDSFLRADAILIGCAFALLLHSNGLPEIARHKGIGVAGVLILLAALVRAALTPRGSSPAVWSFERTGVAIGTVTIIAALIGGASPWLTVVMEHRLARWIGVRSYGIYLWHFPMMRNKTISLHWPHVAWAYALTFVAAALSYRFVETPFLRLKRRLSVVRVAQAA